MSDETITVVEEETETVEISDTEETEIEIIDNVSVGGTSNYEKLNNLPSINDITLIGNKTSSELNVQDKMDTLTNLEIYNLLN